MRSEIEIPEMVTGGVLQLPELQREVLIHARYEPMPLAEIARILDIESTAVKSRLQRARANMKETLAAYAPGAEQRPWTISNSTNYTPSLRAGLRSQPAGRQTAHLGRRSGALVGGVRSGRRCTGAWRVVAQERSAIERGRPAEPRYIRPQGSHGRAGVAKLKWMFRNGRSTGWVWREGKLVGSFYINDRLTHKRYGYSGNAQPTRKREFLFSVQLAPLLQLPAPRTVAAGSVFDIDFYHSGSERVYDHIELSAEPFDIANHPEAEQAGAAITPSNPKLYINGQFAAGSGGVVKATGLTVTVAVPGRGQYVLALDTQGNSRFVRAGSATGQTIEFQSGGDRYRVECSAPVAADGPPGYLCAFSK